MFFMAIYAGFIRIKLGFSMATDIYRYAIAKSTVFIHARLKANLKHLSLLRNCISLYFYISLQSFE